MSDTRTCNRCGIEKSEQGFPEGRNWCRDCVKKYAEEYRKNADNRRKALDRHKLRKFSLTRADVEKMLERQDGKCEICRKPIASIDGRGTHIDHCHATGKVRGILCRNCNVGIGYFNDNIESLRNAIEYLQA